MMVKKLYVVGQDSGSIHGFDLDVAYDLSNITNSETFFVSNRADQPTDAFVQEDTKETLWVVGEGDDKVGNLKIDQKEKRLAR